MQLSKRILEIKHWFANMSAEFAPLQELQYLGEKLWQLK
jgi:hypothetical protein